MKEEKKSIDVWAVFYDGYLIDWAIFQREKDADYWMETAPHNERMEVRQISKAD